MNINLACLLIFIAHDADDLVTCARGQLSEVLSDFTSTSEDDELHAADIVRVGEMKGDRMLTVVEVSKIRIYMLCSGREGSVSLCAR